MAEKRDYYEVLGISKESTEEEIKKAYRQKAKLYHPDLHPDDKEAEAKFKEVNEAYEVLSNADKRQKYDRFGHAGVDPNYGAGQGSGFGFDGGMDFDLGDIFSSFFGGGFGGSSRRADPNAPQRGSDIQTTITLSFEEAAKGCKKTVSYPRIEVCDQCSGSGSAKGSSTKTCPTCQGRGSVISQTRTPFGNIQQQKACTQCGGRGVIITDPCPRCKGKGRIRRTVSVDIDVPTGIDDGQIFQVRGKGNKGINGGSAGDLRVGVNVRPHPFFERQGNDVYCTVSVSYVQAALGAELNIPTLDGKVKYTIPAGTQPGDVFRMRGKGIKSVNGWGQGDQLVTVQVSVPKKLTSQQKEKLRELAAELDDESPFTANPGDKSGGIFGKKKK